MKKSICFIICLFLLMTSAVTVYASEEQVSLAETQGNATDATVESAAHEHSFTLENDTATCGESGTATYRCSCGEVQTKESQATGKHSFGKWSSTGNTLHQRVCTVCGSSEEADHSWDSGKEDPKATCEQEGLFVRTCTACDQTSKPEVIPITEHRFGKWDMSADAHSRTCEICLLDEAGKHSWKEEVTKEPTCKEDGTKKKVCKVCGRTETVLLSRLKEHTYDNVCDETCNVCGETRNVKHSFTTSWSKDHKGHWYECTKCGEKKQETKHTAGPEATEEREQTCTICGYVIAEKKDHTHNYGKTWVTDSVGHWHTCSGCKQEKDYASHSFDDDCDEDCNVCGYKREEFHSFDKTWKNSKKEHWNVCMLCDEETKHEKHIPGPEATDEAPQVCSVCGYEIAPMLEHTHDFGNAWYHDEDTHWQVCKCMEESVPMPHSWDKGKENRDETVTYTCSECGMEKTENMPSAGFPWMIVILSVLAVACAVGIVAIVIVLKRGDFIEEEEITENEAFFEQDSDDEDKLDEEDPEEKMITDFFKGNLTGK